VPSSVPATILVLEKNAAVQELTDQALRESGHRVLTTGNALEAFEVVRRVRVDVVIVGALEGEESGALVRELRSIQAGLRVVSICGPDDDHTRIDRSARLSTPFSLDDLRQAANGGSSRRTMISRILPRGGL
jgi:DNA-binding response OmpR family regulator